MLEWLTQLFAAYGLPIVAVGVLLESAGLPIPGETALLVAAAAAGAGRLPILEVIAVAAGAAILGDAGGYWVGRRGGRPLLERHGQWLRLDRAKLERLEAFFLRQGPKAVFFSRFVSVLRTYTALFAGISRMPYGTFTLYNASGGITWAVLFGVLGYAFGQNLATVERIGGAIGGALLLGVGLVVGAALLWHWAAAHQALLQRWGQAVLAASPVVRLRKSYARQLEWLLARVTPGQVLGLHLTVGVAIAVGGLWLFGGIVQDVLAGDPLVRFDSTVATTLRGWVTPLATTVFQAITRLGSVGVVTLGLGLVAWFGWRRQWLHLAGWLVALGGGELLSVLLTLVLARPRPGVTPPLVEASGFSFPSGHAMLALIAYGMSTYYAIPVLRTWRARTGAVCGAAGLVLLIGFSRLYLGVHYFSDVAGGLAAGTVWLSTCVTAMELIRRGEIGEWWGGQWRHWSRPRGLV